MNTSRSALSTVFNSPPIGEHILVRRFMRSVFNIRPNLPRYNKIWDVSIVLKYLENLSPGKYLNLRQLSHKLVTLIALITGQRSQTIQSLNLEDLNITKHSATFHVNTLLKHNKPNNMKNIVTLTAYPENTKLCAVTYLKYYIKRTKPFRGDKNNLFLATQEPHQPVSSNTIGRWIKSTLTIAGINTKIFKAHSTRAASTSAAFRDVDIDKILGTASWTRASTFAKFYKKPIEDPRTSFGKAVLDRN
jgi:integrase